MLNSFSTSITNSTTSKESAPKSFTNEAVSVTFASSTPNFSHTIFFTFSKVDILYPYVFVNLVALVTQPPFHNKIPFYDQPVKRL